LAGGVECASSAPIFDCKAATDGQSEVDLVLNGSSATECSTAQANAHHHITNAHDFYKTREPDFTGLDKTVPCRVNLEGAVLCDGYTAPGPPDGDRSITTYKSGVIEGGPPCRNGASGSLIVHEYGHYLLYELGVTVQYAYFRGLPIQGDFGEGFGDSLSTIMFDASLQPDFCQLCDGASSLRDYDLTNCTGCPRVMYPTNPPPWSCGTELCFGPFINTGGHLNGKLLAGIWRDLQRNMPSGLETVRQLFCDWSQVTLGGEPTSGEAAHPMTAIEVLVVDDPDGDFASSPPNTCAICDAFLKHNIHCPAMFNCSATCAPDACAGLHAAGGRILVLNVPHCGSDDVSLKVTRTGNGPPLTDLFVQPDGTLSNTETCRPPASWGMVQVNDEEVIPGSQTEDTTYSVYTRCGPGSPETLLDVAATWILGDVDGNLVVDVDDIICALDGFAGCYRCSFRALDICPLEWQPFNGNQRVIDVDDLLAVLNGFSGLPLECPPVGGLLPSSAGESFEPALSARRSAEPAQASLRLSSSSLSYSSGSTMDVEVYVRDAPELRCYQIALDAWDVQGNTMDLQDVAIHTSRPDFAFGELDLHWRADVRNKRMVACLPVDAVNATQEVYLTTFTFAANPAQEPFTVRVRGADTHLRTSNGVPVDYEIPANGELQIGGEQ